MADRDPEIEMDTAMPAPARSSSGTIVRPYLSYQPQSMPVPSSMRSPTFAVVPDGSVRVESPAAGA